MTVGQRLRSAREAKDMTIGDISRRTFIQPKFLHAIEEDNLGVIPDSHRRLFVREYARVVGVGADDVFALLADYEPPPPPVPVATESMAQQRRRFGVEESQERAGSSVPSALDEGDRKAYREILSRLSSGRGMKLSSANLSSWLISGAFILLLLIAAYYIFFSGENEHQDDAASATQDTSGSPTEILTRGSGDTGAVATGTEPTAVADDSLTLEGRATGKVWFAIVMDGKRSETGTLDSGGVKIWRAGETFKLSLGNAGGLTLALNDKSLGTLGPVRTSIRNQVIDANGPRKSLPGRRTTTATTPTQTRRNAQEQNRRRTITPTEMRRAQPTPP